MHLRCSLGSAVSFVCFNRALYKSHYNGYTPDIELFSTTVGEYFICYWCHANLRQILIIIIHGRLGAHVSLIRAFLNQVRKLQNPMIYSKLKRQKTKQETTTTTTKNWYCNSYHLIAEPQGIVPCVMWMVYRTKNWVANRTCIVDQMLSSAH